MRQKSEKEWKRMNASIWLVIEITRKISRRAVNSYTCIVYSAFWHVFLLPCLPNTLPPDSLLLSSINLLTRVMYHQLGSLMRQPLPCLRPGLMTVSIVTGELVIEKNRDVNGEIEISIWCTVSDSQRSL